MVFRPAEDRERFFGGSAAEVFQFSGVEALELFVVGDLLEHEEENPIERRSHGCTSGWRRPEGLLDSA